MTGSAGGTAVKRDQLLEGAAFIEHRVVEAADHDVRDVGEAVRAKQVLWRCGRERGKRVPAIDAPFVQVARPGWAEHHRAVLRGVHQQPADVRVLAQGGE
jgi:hypothetical protein